MINLILLLLLPAALAWIVFLLWMGFMDLQYKRALERWKEYLDEENDE
jgi:hypothetical protein